MKATYYCVLAASQLISTAASIPTGEQQPLAAPTDDGAGSISDSIQCRTRTTVTSETYQSGSDFYSDEPSQEDDNTISITLETSCSAGDENTQEAEQTFSDQTPMMDDDSFDSESQADCISQGSSWFTVTTSTDRVIEEEEEENTVTSSDDFVHGIFKTIVDSTSISLDQARNTGPSASLKAVDAAAFAVRGRINEADLALQDEKCLNQIASVFDEWTATLGEKRGLNVLNAVLAAATPLVMDLSEQRLLHADMDGPKPTWKDFNADVKMLGTRCSHGVPSIRAG